MADQQDPQKKLVDLIDDQRVAMLTTVDDEGHLASRPMARQEVEPSGQMWFISPRDSRKVAQIQANPNVGLAFSSSDSWVSVAGTAEVVDDDAKLKELWNTFADAWMPEGPEDPNAVLIRVDVEGGEYWDTPGSKIATMASLVKAKVTGKPYDGGENETVRM